MQCFKNFMDYSIEFDGDVQSIGFRLEAPHMNRLATIILFDRPTSEAIKYNNEGQSVEPIGVFQLKLSHNGRRDHWPLL